MRLSRRHTSAGAIAPSDPRRMFVGTDIGVYMTEDAGSSWSRMSGGLSNSAVNDLQLSPAGVLRAATDGRGIWECCVVLAAPRNDR